MGSAPSDPSATDRAELALVDAWRHGDSRAIAELLRGYQARVYAVCFRMLRSPDEAKDLTQDALVKVLEGLNSYDGRSQLSTWIIRVAMNCCLSHLRKQKVRRHGSLDDRGRAGERLVEGTEHGATGRVEHDERRAALLRGLNRLDPEVRAILVLRDTQDLEYQQIGEVLGIPVGTVKSRLFRARMALRELVEEELGTDTLESSAPARTACASPTPDS